MFETLPSNPAINPAFAALQQSQPQYARLPKAPINASPVLQLTSLYHNPNAGSYGDRTYPGNCGGNLIKDLLRYFQPQLVFDPMTGSGTCRDVCYELGIACHSTDLKQGFDATNPEHYQELGLFDFIWAHPPYWRQKICSKSPHDLSQCETVERFLDRYADFIQSCADVLLPSGKFAILMGDYSDRKAGFVPLTFYTKQLAFGAGLRQTCTDIIRFSHGATSSKKVYRSAFIPGLHDVCMIFEKPQDASCHQLQSNALNRGGCHEGNL